MEQEDNLMILLSKITGYVADRFVNIPAIASAISDGLIEEVAITKYSTTVLPLL